MHTDWYHEIENDPNTARRDPRLENRRLALEGHLVVAVDRAFELQFMAAPSIRRLDRTKIEDPRSDILTFVKTQRPDPPRPTSKVNGYPRRIRQLDLAQCRVEYDLRFATVTAGLPGRGAPVAEHIGLGRLRIQPRRPQQYRGPQPISHWPHWLNPA